VLSFVPGVTPNKWVSAWVDRMPHLPIDVRPELPAHALTALRDGSSDVALLRLPFDDHELGVIPLYWEKAVAVVPTDHVLEAFETVTLADLVDENVLAGQDTGTVELVAANLGIALMPQSVARALSRRGVVARIITDAPETRIALAWLDGNPDPLIQEFIGIVRGRTANSSRGETPAPEAPVKAAPKVQPKAKPKAGLRPRHLRSNTTRKKRF
jgi:DNA-binding transcriptional LysR family regulator